jgi:hypothetical protein
MGPVLTKLEQVTLATTTLLPVYDSATIPTLLSPPGAYQESDKKPTTWSQLAHQNVTVFTSLARFLAFSIFWLFRHAKAKEKSHSRHSGGSWRLFISIHLNLYVIFKL